MALIYVLEDEEKIRDMLLYALSISGFEAEGFPEGTAFFAAVAKRAPDLALLDIMLPGVDGITILKKLRKEKSAKELPIIMLTAMGSEYDRIKGLDLGADDYITKPFSVMEVMSRIRAVLRRSNNGSGAAGGKEAAVELTVGEITLNTDKRTVSAIGKSVVLTFKEFELLYTLMLNNGIVLSREKLLELVWGQEYFGDTRTVDMHIKTVRQKLGECGGQIKTVRNVGYKIEEKGDNA
jgi:two-component system alkaline phosphatase synthesis response regulator PhoP